MKKEIEELLKEEINSVKQTRLKVITGIILILLDIGLIAASYFHVYNLIFALPLMYIIRRQVYKYRMAKMILLLTRVLIDDDFAQKFNEND